MDSGFVDEDIQFTELGEALLSSFDVIAPSVNLCTVKPQVGLSFMDIFLEEVEGVSVHDGYVWLYEGLCVVDDDPIIQPQSVVQSDEATVCD